MEASQSSDRTTSETTTNRAPSLLIVDDDPLVRAGLSLMLRGAPQLEIVQQIYKRYVDGATRDPRFATMINWVRIMAQQSERGFGSAVGAVVEVVAAEVACLLA